MSEPRAHHYLPRFYLERWTGTDGRLCRYSRPHGHRVKTHRVAPSGTAFETCLYTVRDERPEFANAMEKEFFSKIDDGAAKSLSLLEHDVQNHQWNDESRSSWTRFILAQTLRAPEDIAQLRQSSVAISDEEAAKFADRYLRERKESDPATIHDYLRQHPRRIVDQHAFRTLRTLVNNKRVGEAVNNMIWLTIRVPDSVTDLLTSDRPVWQTITLVEEHAFIRIPIGPRLLFFAARDSATARLLMLREIGELVATTNLCTCRHATKAVYGLDSSKIDLVSANLSAFRYSAISERLAAAQGSRVADPAHTLQRSG